MRRYTMLIAIHYTHHNVERYMYNRDALLPLDHGFSELAHFDAKSRDTRSERCNNLKRLVILNIGGAS